MKKLRLLSYNSYGSERGIFMPLTAVVVVGLFSFFAIYAIDTNRTKIVRAQAETLLTEVCSHGIEAMPMISSALSRVASRLPADGRLSSYGDIQEFVITVPTILDSGTPYLDGLGGVGYKASLSGLIPCDYCSINTDVSHGLFTSDDDGYPVGFVGTGDANSFFGCEVSVEVDHIFPNLLSNSTVHAKIAYALRDAMDRDMIANSKGVVIGIAPQLEVPVTPGSQYDVFAQTSDFSHPLENDVFSFIGERPQFNDDIVDDTRDIPLTGLAFAETGNPSGVDERRALLLGCYNPLIAARNVFLQSFVERLARYAPTRNSSEILLLQPYNFNTDTSSYAFSDDTTKQLRNWPIRMIANSDLLSREYFYPYVNFTVGGAGPYSSTFDGSGDPEDEDYLCPSTDCGGAQQAERLAMSQLQDCFHLFAVTNGLGSKLELDPASTNALQSTFEPIEYQTLDYTLPLFTPSSSQGWSQTASYCDGLSSPGHCALTAPELMNFMGRVEFCPTPAAGCSKLDETGAEKEYHSLDPNAFRGDIVAFLQYLNSDGTPPGGDRDKPGAWPRQGHIHDSPSVTTDRVGNVPEDDRHIFLIVHRPIVGDCSDSPSPDDECGTIRQILTTGSLQTRQLTVVYFPPDYLSVTDASKDQFLKAFRILDDNREEGERGLRTLYIYYPYHPAAGVPSDNLPWNQYWVRGLGLTNSGTNENFWDHADFIFHEHVVKPELAL